jgi:hypothetical protein
MAVFDRYAEKINQAKSFVYFCGHTCTRIIEFVLILAKLVHLFGNFIID